MLYANEHMGHLARAPHAYLPMLVCDKLPAERSMALRFGLELLVQSDLLLVCGNVLSKGMRGEITHAAKLGMPSWQSGCLLRFLPMPDWFWLEMRISSLP